MWYAVPTELPPGQRKGDGAIKDPFLRPAVVVNEWGEQVAEFEELRDAVKAAEKANNPRKRLTWDDLSESQKEEARQVVQEAFFGSDSGAA